MADNPVPIRIAIIGGGLAGVTLANALIQIPHLDIQVYESAPSFSERGAALALGTNAQQALEEILPSGKGVIFKRAGAVPINSARSIVGSGPHAGETILDLSGEDPGIIVHRASLLRELVATLPESSLHTDKKLVSIDVRPDTGDAPAAKALQIVFEDGTIDEADAVIGADGVFGLVRSHVLQGEAEKHPASPAGFWDSRLLIPIEKARHVFGETSFDADRQTGWVGDSAFLMLDALENGTVVQCIVSAIEQPSPMHDRKREVAVETLTQTLASWHDNPIAKGMIELCREQGGFEGYSQWEHKSTPMYANGHVCVLGDAAHATTPWQGSGAAMAFEDVMILQELLGSVTSPRDIPAAFKTYDVLRRPRCQRVIDSSVEVGRIFCGQSGLVPGELRELLAPKWDFIFSLDMNAHKREALQRFREMQQD